MINFQSHCVHLTLTHSSKSSHTHDCSRTRTEGRNLGMECSLYQSRDAKGEEVPFCMGCYAPNQIHSNGIGKSINDDLSVPYGLIRTVRH